MRLFGFQFGSTVQPAQSAPTLERVSSATESQDTLDVIEPARRRVLQDWAAALERSSQQNKYNLSRVAKDLEATHRHLRTGAPHPCYDPAPLTSLDLDLMGGILTESIQQVDEARDLASDMKAFYLGLTGSPYARTAPNSTAYEMLECFHKGIAIGKTLGQDMSAVINAVEELRLSDAMQRLTPQDGNQTQANIPR